MAYVLGFTMQWGLFGLWTGLTVGVLLAAGASLIICLRIDWGFEVTRNQTRINESTSLVSAIRAASEDTPLLQDAQKAKLAA